MKAILAGVLLIPALLAAEPVQVDKKVTCDKVDTVIGELTKNYGEQPLWFGNSQDSKVVVLVNPKNGGWSVVQFNDKVACVLEVGEGFQLRSGQTGGKNI